MFLRRTACALAAIGFGLSAETASAQNCALQQIASIPASLSPNNQLLLDGVMDEVPVKIAVDTGASVSTVSEPFVKRLGVPLIPLPGVFYGLGGTTLKYRAVVESFKLGNFHSDHQRFAVMPIGGDGNDANPVALLGGDHLSRYDIEFDLVNNVVNFFSQDHCPGAGVYWDSEYFKLPVFLQDNIRPTVQVQVDGQNLKALVDTGASVTMMRQAIAETKFHLTMGSPDTALVGTSTGVTGESINAYLHVFSALTFGGITLHDTKIRIAPMDVAALASKTGSHIKGLDEHQHDMLIGMSLLRQLHIFLSYKDSALYYTLAKKKTAS